MRRISVIMFVLALVFAAGLAADLAFAKKPAPPPPPPKGCECPDVYQPVLCSNGQVYSNLCVATCAGATGCVPYGDTILSEASEAPVCEGFDAAALENAASACRCPLYYAPVVCDRGRTYPNQCVADCHNAKNCVPAGL